jgi:hypothetical protein
VNCLLPIPLRLTNSSQILKVTQIVGLWPSLMSWVACLLLTCCSWTVTESIWQPWGKQVGKNTNKITQVLKPSVMTGTASLMFKGLTEWWWEKGGRWSRQNSLLKISTLYSLEPINMLPHVSKGSLHMWSVKEPWGRGIVSYYSGGPGVFAGSLEVRNRVKKEIWRCSATGFERQREKLEPKVMETGKGKEMNFP